MTETRKLAAILAADVVGFSRLTGLDEEGTLAQLRALRQESSTPQRRRMADAFQAHRRWFPGGIP